MRSVITKIVSRKVLTIIILIVLASIIYVLINYAPSVPGDVNLSDEKYREAYDNCVSFLLNDSGWDVKRFDFSEVSIESMPDIYRSCYTIDGSQYYFRSDTEYWLITIGDRTRGHDYAPLVVNSQNNEVVGFLLIM